MLARIERIIAQIECIHLFWWTECICLIQLTHTYSHCTLKHKHLLQLPFSAPPPLTVCSPDPLVMVPSRQTGGHWPEDPQECGGSCPLVLGPGPRCSQLITADQAPASLTPPRHAPIVSTQRNNTHGGHNKFIATKVLNIRHTLALKCEM